MTASDDARDALHDPAAGRTFATVDYLLAATLPDGRTIAAALDALPEVEAERDALRAALTDRDQYQQKATALVEDRWPQGDQSAGEDLARRVLALCEEAGEVARCVLKAGASHSGYRSDTDWVEQMFIEVGQVGFVLATIAEAVGFDHWEAEQAAMADVESKPTAAERARLLLTDRTDGDDGAGIMHGVDW